MAPQENLNFLSRARADAPPGPTESLAEGIKLAPPLPLLALGGWESQLGHEVRNGRQCKECLNE